MLKIDRLNKKYNEKLVLQDVSFEIKQGEIVTILGANGSGKTTIINCILKMIRPNSGTILYRGHPLFVCILDFSERCFI